MKTIYVLEDNDSIREGLQAYLELSGLQVNSFCCIKDFEKRLQIERPDLAILDVMLPDGDGFLLAKRLLKSHSFPIMFMTAKSSESDRIMGFELGADDYVVKPFSPKELVLRVKAILNRTSPAEVRDKSHQSWRMDDDLMDLDTERHLLQMNGSAVQLTAAEWKILLFLIDHAGIVISREQILDLCLNYSCDTNDRIVDTHIKNIRSKLESNQWIATVRGYGYLFAGKRDQVIAV